MGRPVSSLAQLDPADLLALLENLEACRATGEGPEARVVPESLCVEIEQCLKLLRAEVRAARGLRES